MGEPDGPCAHAHARLASATAKIQIVKVEHEACIEAHPAGLQRGFGGSQKKPIEKFTGGRGWAEVAPSRLTRSLTVPHPTR